jgi:hypothetical protein
MKTLLTYLLLLTITCSAATNILITGPGVTIRGPVSINVPVANPQTFLINQGFEGTGFDNSEAFWYPEANADEDFSTSGLSLDGSQCLELDATTTIASCRAYNAFTRKTACYFFFKYRTKVLPTTVSTIARIEDGFDTLAICYILSSGALYVKNGSASAVQTTSTLSVDTTYYIWINYASGTGVNGVATVGFSSNGTRPTSGNNNYAECIDGTSTIGCRGINLSCERDGTNMKSYFDHVLVSETQIGDNP